MKRLNALALSVGSVCLFLSVIALAGPRNAKSGTRAEAPKSGPEREGLGTYFPGTEKKAYKGPLTMATDLLVWNVTKENIKVRRVIVNEASWPAKPVTPPGQPDPKQRTPFSAFVDNGREDVAKELAPQIEQFKKEHGLK